MYCHQGIATHEQWGVIDLEGDRPADLASAHCWFGSLSDAFYSSRAWPDGPPDDERTYFRKKSLEERSIADMSD